MFMKLIDKPKNLTIKVISELQNLDEDAYYQIEIKQGKDKRSLDQNAKLWAMISQASKAMNQDTNTTYCNLLLQTEAKYDFIAISPNPEIIKQLESQFRAIKFRQETESAKGKAMHVYQVFYGSSKFNVAEMSELIDRAYDLLAELGIYEERESDTHA